MKTLCRLILSDWAVDGSKKKVLEGEFTEDEILNYNFQGYNVYYLPNHPKAYNSNTTIDGTHIDCWNYVFVDCDYRDGKFKTKDEFLKTIYESGIKPSSIVNSGRGVHVYWKITDLTAKSYLRFQRRLIRLFNTDEAVGQLFQLMRLPGTLNTKEKNNQVICEIIEINEKTYTSEEFDKLLPPITQADEQYCQQHYDRTFNLNQAHISEEMPYKWGKLLSTNLEVKKLFTNSESDDRSKNDYRLGHIMFANGFTKQEAASVLMNSAKASQRAPVHRASYAQNIVDKIWTYELEPEKKSELSMTIAEILANSKSDIKGTRFACHPRIDNTEHGFRLGQVIGLVAGSGVGKTAFALNMFRWFAQTNPEYNHVFVPLEQPVNEIADRWKTMCGNDTSLHDKIHLISNYDEDGNFRHLSLQQIKDYIIELKTKKGLKIGCVVIDHMGALAKQVKNGENEGLMGICHEMKGFAVQTNTLLVMQSQSNREKAGIGDKELNKDAAYGTTTFEWYCDYLITMWQPLKRCHNEQNCPTVSAFKFCKIRHKKAHKDVIKEDTPYYMYFNPETEQLEDMTQDQKVAFQFFFTKATNKRNADQGVELVEYKSVPYKKETNESKTTHH